MNYEDLIGVIENRRSIRKFKDESISKETVIRLINAARWAPSDTNQQPWNFIAVLDREKIQKIAEITMNAIDGLKEKAEANGRTDISKKLDVFMRYSLVFKNAPAIILAVAEPYRSRFTEEIFKPLEFGEELLMEESIKSVSLAVQNILLTAHSLGLATCPMSAPILLAENELKDNLGISKENRIVMLVALGVPEGPSSPPPRKPVEQILTYIE